MTFETIFMYLSGDSDKTDTVLVPLETYDLVKEKCSPPQNRENIVCQADEGDGEWQQCHR